MASAAAPEVNLDPVALAEATTAAVSRALAEDLDQAGDVTTAATVRPDEHGEANIVARAPGVVCGTAVATEVFAQVDERVVVDFDVADGQGVDAARIIGRVRGRLASILTGERTALNFLGHLSGVATRTHAFVVATGGRVAVRDTRKTTPGLRLLEKDAVRAGGGSNHRIGLFDALLVKENHIAAAGSVTAAVRAALAGAGGRPVQIEVTSLEELEAALTNGATDVLLDNFTPAGVRAAVQRTAGRAVLEASGNITLASCRDYAATGVDRVAIGGITHSAPWLDVALDVQAPSAGDAGGR